MYLCERIKTGAILNLQVFKMFDDNKTRANVKSRNDFIEKAIKHYVDYLNVLNNSLLLDEEITAVFETQLNGTKEKINKFLFKLSVAL
jgi:metal-responsive CopG/Arc/MetJ family transcriptional regulator